MTAMPARTAAITSAHRWTTVPCRLRRESPPGRLLRRRGPSSRPNPRPPQSGPPPKRPPEIAFGKSILDALHLDDLDTGDLLLLFLLFFLFKQQADEELLIAIGLLLIL